MVFSHSKLTRPRHQRSLGEIFRGSSCSIARWGRTIGQGAGRAAVTSDSQILASVLEESPSMLLQGETVEVSSGLTDSDIWGIVWKLCMVSVTQAEELFWILMYWCFMLDTDTVRAYNVAGVYLIPNNPCLITKKSRRQKKVKLGNTFIHQNLDSVI